MDYNYHTHTYRCSHATGTEEEYIQRAIACGVRFMGFSDHAPLRFADGSESGHRVPVAAAEDYIRDVRVLREKYRDEIDIRIGFEVEYYPEYFPNQLEDMKKAGAEYLILGQHYPHPENEAGVSHVMAGSDRLSDLQEYVSIVISAMKTGCFTYVAHPDMYVYFGDTKEFQEEMRKICLASLELGIPLELNLLGIRDSRNYPNPEFWKVAGEVGCPVVYGCDAHTASDAYDGESLKLAEGLKKAYGLHVIGKPNIIQI